MNISLILIGICILVIITIILKKFPALAILDTENIPEEQENKFKERIMRKRFERDFDKYTSGISQVFNFVFSNLEFAFKSLYKELKNLRHKHQSEKKVLPEEKENKFETLIKEAQEFKSQESYQSAEQKYIEAIALDDKNISVFSELAEVYWNMRKYREAKETYNYVIKLAKKENNKREQAEAYYNLSRLYKQEDDLFKAIDSIYSALEIEENNPRFLDFLLDLEIKNKDKQAAEQIYDKLKTINPDNKKLEEYKKQIEELA